MPSGLRARFEHHVAQGPPGLEHPAEDVDQRLEPRCATEEHPQVLPEMFLDGAPVDSGHRGVEQHEPEALVEHGDRQRRLAHRQVQCRLQAQRLVRTRESAHEGIRPQHALRTSRRWTGLTPTPIHRSVHRASKEGVRNHPEGRPRAHFPNNPWSRFRASSSACWRSFSASDCAFCSPCVVSVPAEPEPPSAPGGGLAEVGFADQRADGARAGEPGDGERGRLHVEPGDLRSPRRPAEAERDRDGLGRRHLAAGERLHRRRGQRHGAGQREGPGEPDATAERDARLRQLHRDRLGQLRPRRCRR